MEKIKACSFCGLPDYSDGGNDMIIEHHPKGRSREDSEKGKIFYCERHHQVAECREYVNLPFTNFQITGKLFDIYAVKKNIEEIEELINTGEYNQYWQYVDF